jgi:hypothetical protein
LGLLAAGCSQAQFAGDTPRRAQASPETSICMGSGDECMPTPPPVTCQDGSLPIDGTCPEPPPAQEPAASCDEGAIGAQIAFMIDNSSSNEATDCPEARATGRRKPGGAPVFACEAETHREKAVLSAFDLLARVAADDADERRALSALSLVSFPVTENAGFERQLSWTPAEGSGRRALAEALRFARAPWGQTPYGEAFQGARELFGEASSDERQKVAILVTDGLPTDGRPRAVATMADELRAGGVKVITIFVTGPAARAERQQTHRAMLRRFADASERAGQSWYDSSDYSGFEAYAEAILGLASQVAAGEVVEVADASALERAVLGVVGKSLRCEP